MSLPLRWFHAVRSLIYSGMTERQWYALCAVILVVTAAIDAYTPLGIVAGVGYLFAVVVAGMVYEVRFPWRVAVFQEDIRQAEGQHFPREPHRLAIGANDAEPVV